MIENPYAYFHGDKPKEEKKETTRDEMTLAEALRIEADIANQKAARERAMARHEQLLANGPEATYD